MMYTRKKFGEELKNRVHSKQPTELIGHWAYSVYLDYTDAKDDDFLNILLTLNTMEEGPEFEFTYEELEKIADDLIAGKDVKL